MNPGKLANILADAKRLQERGPGSMYPEDEARHMAGEVLALLIETLEVLGCAEVRDVMRLARPVGHGDEGRK